jgi:hypothetical protein
VVKKRAFCGLVFIAEWGLLVCRTVIVWFDSGLWNVLILTDDFRNLRSFADLFVTSLSPSYNSVHPK